MAKAKRAAVGKRTATDATTQTFVEAGFSVEQVGKVTTLYSRKVSEDVVEASRALTRGRTMECPPRDKSKRD